MTSSSHDHLEMAISELNTASLRTKVLNFRGFDSSRILVLRAGIPRSIGEFPGNYESTNLSRDNLSREIGRSSHDHLETVIFEPNRDSSPILILQTQVTTSR